MPDIDLWGLPEPQVEEGFEKKRGLEDPWGIPPTDPRKESFATSALKEQAVLDYNKSMLKHRRTGTQKYLEFHAGKEVDTKRGGDFLDRVSSSFEDDPSDIVTKLQRKHPQAYVQRMEIPEDLGGGTRILIDPDPSNPYLSAYTLEDDGITWNDAADLVGPAIPAATSILASLIGGGTGVILNSLKYGLGYLGGKLGAEETNRQLFGGEQPYIGAEGQEGILSESLKEAGIETGIGLATGGAGAAINKLMHRGRHAQSPDVLNALDAIDDLRTQGVDVPPLMLDQMFSDNPTLKAAANQARSTTPELVIRGRQQQAGATEALEGMLKTSPEQLRINIHKRANNVYTAKHKEALSATTGGRLVTPKMGGESLQKGLQEWDKKAWGEVKDSYKKVDDFASLEKPTFDLTNSQAKAQDILEGVTGIGKPVKEPLTIKGPKGETLYRYTRPDIKADDTPEGKLGEVMNRFMQLDPIQDNYEVLKTIRSDAGKVIKQWPWEKSENIGAAKRFYAVLTDAMMNPASSAPKYAAGMAEATGKARGYYDVVAKANFKKAVASENPILLQQYFANPSNITDDLIDTIKTQPHSKVFKESIQQSILNANDPVEQLTKWKMINEDALRSLVAPGKEYNQLKEAAIKMKRLKESDLKKINDDVSFGLSSVENLVSRKDLSTREIKETISDFGGYNSPGHKTLREGAFASVIEKSITDYDKFGNPVVSPRSINKAVAELKRTGVWNTLLTDTDRTMMLGLHQYINAIKGAQDVGVSLQRAGTVAALKDIFNPLSTLQAMGDLKVNQGLAKILTNESLARFLTSSESRRAFTGNHLMRANLVADALLEGVEPGQEESMVTNATRAYRDFTENPVSEDKPDLNMDQGPIKTKKNMFDFSFPEVKELEQGDIPKSNPGKAKGARGLRNNNPGNIEKSDINWQGKTTGEDPRFETFQTPEHGIRALGLNLKAYQDKHGLNTVRGIINRWAPPSENNTSSYVRQVANDIGVKPNDEIDLDNSQTMQLLIKAIIKHENGTNPYSDDTIANAINMIQNEG